MELFKEHTRELRLTDFNCFEQLQPSAVLDLFQDLATEHCAEMGIGLHDLRKKELFWVVVRQKLEFSPNITCTPGQTVVVRTWPHSATRLNILRDYRLSNEDGTVIAQATSAWLMLDIKTRRVASVLENYSGPTDFLPDRAFAEKMKKIKEFETIEQPAEILTPRFSDIDINKHVNNARYLDYAQNVAPPTQNKSLRSLQIDYRKEILPSTPVKLFVSEGATSEGTTSTQVKGTNEEGDVNFNCVLTYDTE